jgi:predicted TIM-barrel fold metal-dependent hydrolase
MPERLTIISADDHAGPPPETYREYFESKYHEEFDRYMGARVSFGLQEDFQLEGEAAKRWKAELVEPGRANGTWDPERRIKELEDEGVVAEVIYPDGVRDNEIPFAGAFGVGRSTYSLELVKAGQRAYNRWLAEFCGTHPDRMGGLALVQFADVEHAVEVIEWAAEQPGIRGIMVPGINPKLPPYFSKKYDPIWSAIVDNDLSANVHTGGSDDIGFGGDPDAEDLSEALMGGAMFLITMTEVTFFAHRPFWFLVGGGVLDRFPSLRVAFTEQKADWIPPVMDYMDFIYERMPVKGLRGIDHKPSDYWKRQCFVGASTPSRIEAELRHEIGLENMMFGIDYPHFEGTWGRTRRFIRATFGHAGTTPEEARKLFAENAANCYGFDLAVLDEVAQCVGPTIDEVLTPEEVDINDPFYSMVFRPQFI